MNPMKIRSGRSLLFRGGNEVLRMQISRREVRRELGNYMEDDVSWELKTRIEQHFLRCEGCFATYDGLRRVIRLINGAEIIELPEGSAVRFSSSIPTKRHLPYS